MAPPLWTLNEVASALGLDIYKENPRPITGVSIDTRTISEGELFVAIIGETHDGHEYVKNAFEKGAVAAVVSRDESAGGPLFLVSDTQAALEDLGRFARARANANVAAVTGSVGKTGTKEMLRTMLSASGEVHASEKSYNNLWGVPLSLARMPRDCAFAVFEIGMNHAGEITPLTKLVRPHVAMITTIAPVHIEFFASLSAIADAKAEIFDGMDQGGLAVLPADDGEFERLNAKALAKGLEVLAFGSAKDAASRLVEVRGLPEASVVTAEILGEKITFVLPVAGRHLALNAVGALTAAKALGADVITSAAALSTYKTPDGRGRRTLFQLGCGGSLLLIDETYNANPASMRAALEVLGDVPRKEFARRIAVLGDMLELGQDSARYHGELSAFVDRYGIDLVFCAGPLMANLYKELPADKRGGHAPSSDELKADLLKTLSPGDAVMIKGSLGSKMGVLATAVRTAFAESAPKP